MPQSMPSTNFWIPEWATVDLHERTLDELCIVEAMYPDECRVCTPDVRQHLEDCVSRRSVSAKFEPLRIDIEYRLDVPDDSDFRVILEFSLPPYYPTHVASLNLRATDRSHRQQAVYHLEQRARAELVARGEEVEVILPILEWFAEHGAAEVVVCEAVAPAPAAPASASTSAASVKQAKRDRIEQARAERLSSKYSETPNLDLCYTFVKHGYCKEKDCQWRHAVPGKPALTGKSSTLRASVMRKMG